MIRTLVIASYFLEQKKMQFFLLQKQGSAKSCTAYLSDDLLEPYLDISNFASLSVKKFLIQGRCVFRHLVKIWKYRGSTPILTNVVCHYFCSFQNQNDCSNCIGYISPIPAYGKEKSFYEEGKNSICRHWMENFLFHFNIYRHLVTT